MSVEPKERPAAEQEIQAPSVGRIVHVRTNSGECRPAIVLWAWSPGDWRDAVNLTVFTDWANDSRDSDPSLGGVIWRTGVLHESLKPADYAAEAFRYWHWPERA